MWKRNCKDDEIFYDLLCTKYFEHIYYYCKRLVKGQNQLIDFVEECTQDTFLEARIQISKLRNHPNVEGWLFKTARNLINTSYRSMYTKKKHEINMEDDICFNLAESDKEIEKIFDILMWMWIR